MGRPSKYLHGWPGVTSIISLGGNFEFWHKSVAKKNPGQNPFDICEKIKRDSQDIGHRIHDGIERYLTGQSITEIEEGLTDQEKRMLGILTKWCDRESFKPTRMECSVYSEKHQFAGTFDAHNGEYFVDWKTDKAPRPGAQSVERRLKYGLQAGGYSIAEEEGTGVLVNKAKFVRAAKDFSHHVEVFDDLTEYRKNFLIVREAYRILKGK